jgi:hypothetical protein
MTITNSEAVSDAELNEMLAGLEGVTPGPYDVWAEPTPTKDAAIDELAYQVMQSEPFAEAVYLLNAGGKCPATTGCGPSSEANAAHFARCDPDTIRYLVTQELSRRAANSAGGVEVKALEWRVNGNGWCADTPFGLYDFSQYGSRWAVYLSGGLIAEPESKDACERVSQADFNQRILSAIVPAVEAEPVAWQHKLTGVIRTDKPAVSMGLHEDYDPLYTHPSSPVSAEVTVTDEMVERAVASSRSWATPITRAGIRRILAAALNGKE